MSGDASAASSWLEALDALAAVLRVTLLHDTDGEAGANQIFLGELNRRYLYFAVVPG